MPFDGTGFPERRRRRSRGHENLVTALIVGVALLLLVLPVSLAALGDLVRFLRHGQ